MRKWLKCEISKGMFSDEVTVKVQDAGGEPVAVFVPKNQVRVDQPTVSVRMYEGYGKTFAILPDERHTAVAVTSSDLQTA
jgi:hypothetical protein